MPTAPPVRFIVIDHLRIAVPTVLEVLGVRPARLSAVGARFAALMRPPPKILNPDQIPPALPFVLTFNHYESGRVAAWWGPLLIAYAVRTRRTSPPLELQFVMTREWLYSDWFGRTIKGPFTRWLFGRLAKVYGFVRMPSVVDGYFEPGRGMLGVRQALRMTRGDKPALLALSPEGRTGEGGALLPLRPGTGLFLWHLTQGRLPVLPVGLYEEGGAFVVNFGSPYLLTCPKALDRSIRDNELARQVMKKLAEVVPPQMRGEYA